MRLSRFSTVGILAVVALAGSGFGAELLAQSASTPAPTLRAYTHIFVAYAVAWLLVLGWVLRIASTLKRASNAT